MTTPENEPKPPASPLHPKLPFFCFWACALMVAPPIDVRGAVTMNWATVGYPGNAPDVATGLGSVGTIFRIATEEVTNAQYTEFLNTVDPTGANPNGVYHSRMGTYDRGGIDFLPGNPEGSRYAVRAHMGDKPVNMTDWFSAARFANWMHNGQGNGGTETGAYDMTTEVPVRLSGAQVFLPSEDEWYKAAYFDPVSAGADGSGTLDYWLYPTMSDAAPILGTASETGDISNPGANVANYDREANWVGRDGNVTTLGNVTSVGTATSTSFFGAFDMAGNVMEWTESYSGDVRIIRDLRGGSFFNGLASLQSSGPAGGALAGTVADNNGFRLASIPEPNAAALLAGAAGLFTLRRRRSSMHVGG